MENQSPLYIGNSFVYHERLYNNLNEMGLTIEVIHLTYDNHLK